MKTSKNTPGGVLVRLKNKISLAMKIDPSKLKVLVDRYVMKSFKGRVNQRVHYDRVNTYGELTRTEMTIKVFFKFLKILDPKSVKISIEIVTRRGDVYNVSEEIRFMKSLDEPTVEEEKEE